MTENVKTIEMKGIRLGVKNKEPEPFRLTITADTKNKDQLISIYWFTTEDFFSEYLGAVFILFEIKGRHFDSLKETIDFFGGEYNFCDFLGIPQKEHKDKPYSNRFFNFLGNLQKKDKYRPYIVTNVEAVYTDLQNEAEVKKDLNPIEKRKEIVNEYLHRVSKEYGSDADEEQIERVMKELFK